MKPRTRIDWHVGWPTEYLVVTGWDGKDKGYFPRAVAERDLGIVIAPEGQTTWFTREQSKAMRSHPLWESVEEVAGGSR